MQKAFINRINGTTEHNQVLLELIRHAKANRKTLHMTFFDLEDAFGSVHHSLISKGLERFMFAAEVISYISGLYRAISGNVVRKNWSSEPFHFKKGVFQGDPLSPIIFLIAFNPILEKLNTYSDKGYTLNPGKNIICTPFADDFNLCTTNRRTHQKLLNEISSLTKSMQLKQVPRRMSVKLTKSLHAIKFPG